MQRGRPVTGRAGAGPVVLAVGAALAVALPAALLAQVLDALGAGDGLGAVAYLLAAVVLAGIAIGGWTAAGGVAKRSVRVAVWRGAVTGATAVLVVLAVGIARRLAAGDEVAWSTVPATVLLAAATSGGAGALRVRRAGRTRS